ncbi:XRE family transcriptional regulator [Clostridiaceae bacterium OM08-6BH]|nr:XRE family transcriptional regulator [Clostridiaceae bacterium OM08-6BH]
MAFEIGSTLKKYRNEAKISVKQISDILISKGFKASEKTIYSWESGNSQPTPDALLIMCDAYGIKDVLSAFGYDGYNDDGSLLLNLEEIKHIEKYRSLDPAGQKHVDTVLQWEVDHSSLLSEKNTKIQNLTNRLRGYSDEILNAAHDNGATLEQAAAADAIMKDPKEWE